MLADNLTLLAFAVVSLAMQQSIDISCPLGRRQQTTEEACSGRITEQTDRRTLGSFIDPAVHTMQSVSKSQTKNLLVVKLSHKTVFLYMYTHTHTHPFNSPFSGTTQVSRYQKGKTNLDFTEARDSGPSHIPGI